MKFSGFMAAAADSVVPGIPDLEGDGCSSSFNSRRSPMSVNASVVAAGTEAHPRRRRAWWQLHREPRLVTQPFTGPRSIRNNTSHSNDTLFMYKEHVLAFGHDL